MPSQSLVGAVVDRQAVIRSYLENRARSQALFDLLDDAAYYERPNPLRHPVVFYEGHIPAFSVICFLQRALGHAGIDPALEALFACESIWTESSHKYEADGIAAMGIRAGFSLRQQWIEPDARFALTLLEA